MKGLSVILVFWLLIATSCDPCDNCGEPLLFEPTVALVFINKDTLGKINITLENVSDSLDKTEASEGVASNELDSLENRLIIVNDSIDNGNSSYEEERTTLEDLIVTYLDSTNYYAELITKIDSVADYLTTKRSEVLKGFLRVDTLYINEQYLTYSDSFEIYDAPLLMNEESFTQFEVIIGDFKGEISFDYDLVEFVDATREIKLRAVNITPMESLVAWDSVGDPICETEQCRDHETTLYLYFN